jgi:hypothetical protein
MPSRNSCDTSPIFLVVAYCSIPLAIKLVKIHKQSVAAGSEQYHLKFEILIRPNESFQSSFGLDYEKPFRVFPYLVR